ncbi:MAG TPA: hypothetical protein ENK35_02630 [Candidatus Tenderia sp.]|nr:hypothetical protein [Candidatus Tenderia sp.]
MKRNVIALVAAALFAPPSLCLANELSYDFIQLSLAYTSFQDAPSPTRGFDLDLKKSMNERAFFYGAFGTGSVSTVFGGVEVADLLVGAGFGVGYHRPVYKKIDLVSTVEIYQIDIQPGALPVSLNAFSLGAGLRGKINKKAEGNLFASYAKVREVFTYSLDLQLDYPLNRRLLVSGGIDLLNLRAFSVGLRSNF